MLADVIGGAPSDNPPIWLMRQAGRYLPEYRALRSQKGGFLDLVYDSDAAAEITLQPIRRFDFDAAILFSDILVVPQAMGQKLWFEEGEGPRLAPRLIEHDWHKLEPNLDFLCPIYETIRKVRQQLQPEKNLIGFAGSPWTVATYMLNGCGSKDQAEARRYAYQSPDYIKGLLAAITAVTVTYLKRQIDAGVDVIQLFESWAGAVSAKHFEDYVIGPNAEIVAGLKAYAPHVPIIGFPRGSGGKLAAYVTGTSVDAVGLDETVDPHWADSVLPKGLTVQGNLDPLVLETGGEAMSEAAQNIINAFHDRPHIFNLGHGILQTTPIANVEALTALVRRHR